MNRSEFSGSADGEPEMEKFKMNRFLNCVILIINSVKFCQYGDIYKTNMFWENSAIIM